MNDTCKRSCGTEVHYFAASRFRDMMSFSVSSNGIGFIKADKVEGPFINYEDARAALHGMDTDDCDYGVFTFRNGEWYAVRLDRNSHKQILSKRRCRRE